MHADVSGERQSGHSLPKHQGFQSTKGRPLMPVTCRPLSGGSGGDGSGKVEIAARVRAAGGTVEVRLKINLHRALRVGAGVVLPGLTDDEGIIPDADTEPGDAHATGPGEWRVVQRDAAERDQAGVTAVRKGGLDEDILDADASVWARTVGPVHRPPVVWAVVGGPPLDAGGVGRVNERLRVDEGAEPDRAADAGRCCRCSSGDGCALHHRRGDEEGGGGGREEEA
jgi:hypothetical protein